MRALPIEMPTEATCVWSIFCSATRSPLVSTTAIESFQLRGDFEASAIVAAIAFCALARSIEAPYGTSNGIWSGTGGGCGAGAGAGAVAWACAAVAKARQSTKRVRVYASVIPPNLVDQVLFLAALIGACSFTLPA